MPFDGTRIRVLTIVDACSRISPAIDVRRSYRGADVVETLERVVARHGLPRQIRLDNVLCREARGRVGQPVSIASLG